MLRVRNARRLCSCARKSYGRWDFLPRVEPVGIREVRAAPNPLPPPKYVDIGGRCSLEYFEIHPREDAQVGHQPPVTFVLLHGAPGSYNDFRHLVPLLQQQSHIRVVGINLPGYAGSTVASENYLDSISALPTAQLTLEAVCKLCKDQEGSDNVFLVGHSFGAHTAINIAVLNAMQDVASGVTFRGMALLSPAGCRPHRVLRPKESEMVVKLLQKENLVVNWLLSHVIKTVYTQLLRFPSGLPPGHYVAGVIRAGTTNFSSIREQVDLLKRVRMPALVAWSESDEFMESEVPAELALLCHPGPRIAFRGGGHNIQKTRAEAISIALKKWVERVLADEADGSNEQTQYLPSSRQTLHCSQ